MMKHTGYCIAFILLVSVLFLFITGCESVVQNNVAVKSVSCGTFHTMILKTDGTLWATGYNGDGQLGDGTTVNVITPKQVM